MIEMLRLLSDLLLSLVEFEYRQV